jgi:hypothetical protein
MEKVYASKPEGKKKEQEILLLIRSFKAFTDTF